jgi:transposase-like protein
MDAKTPSTLKEAITYFADPDNCVSWMVARRWPNGVECPTCGSKKVSYQAANRRWQCGSHHAKRLFTLKTGTIMEDSPIGLDKWLPVIWLVTNCKNGISSWEIHRAMGVTQKTAWFMLQRARLALQGKQGGKLSGEIEADESFIGGKARFMHRDKRAEKIHGRGPEGKAIVAAVLERGGEIRAKVVPTRRKKELYQHVTENVEKGSEVFTDELLSYDALNAEFRHQVINHAEEYVRGNVHTNGCENFWSLLKRGIGGTYVSVEPFHLFRYVDEQAFRYNHRKHVDGEVKTDAERFEIAVSQIVGKRLTYAELTGHSDDEPF